jgi:hypothetical protein
MKTYYKIVAKTADELRSCSISARWCGDYDIKYVLGKPVQGFNDTPLFVFDCLSSAEYFVKGGAGLSTPAKKYNSFTTLHIYECHVTNPHRIEEICETLEGCILSEFWKRRIKGACFPYSVSASPSGTVICDTVTLLKEV